MRAVIRYIGRICKNKVFRDASEAMNRKRGGQKIYEILYILIKKHLHIHRNFFYKKNFTYVAIKKCIKKVKKSAKNTISYHGPRNPQNG